MGKEDTAVGCVSHEPVVTAMLALMVGLGREAPTALSLPGLRACVWAVTQQRRERSVPGACPSPAAPVAFRPGSAALIRCQGLTLIHTRE